jgi:glutamine cyclotransferase
VHAFSALLVAALTAVVGGAASAPPVTPSDVSLLEWHVVSRRPHDAQASTQGLQFGADGGLYESTGRYGRSTLREVDASSGDVLRSVALPDDHFGEGLAWADGRLVQLTWKAGVATVRDPADFGILETFEYDGEGWGLCFDGSRFVASDGSDVLTFRDPLTFATLGRLEVTLAGEPLGRLNELECVDGQVWANVWKTDAIVRIDARTGAVTGLLRLTGILEPMPPTAGVLNGIAWNAQTGTFLVTGKLWPELIEIRVSEPGSATDSAR